MNLFSRYRAWAMATPRQFILNWGVLFFGGLWAAVMILWSLPELVADPGKAVIMVPILVVAAAIAGFLWGFIMWHYIKWQKRRLERRQTKGENSN